MKKFNLVTLMILLTVYLNAQHWSTGLNDGSGNPRIGTNNAYPFRLFTNNSERVRIDSSGNFQINSLASSEPGFLLVDEHGMLYKGLNGIGTCGGILAPWTFGGNSMSASGQNYIGTCNNYDFILQANNKKTVFINATTGYVAVGVNNTTPSAVLDIRDPLNANTEHTRIYGDADGSIEATNKMTMFYGSDFAIRNGSYQSSGAMFEMDNSGRAAFGSGAINTSFKLTLDGAGLLSKVGGSDRGLAVLNTANSTMPFKVMGDGRTIIGDVSGAPTGAMLNLNANMNVINVINVYDEATVSSCFRVKNNGYVYCRELNVLPNNIAFPDYVFDPDYKLLPLKELENYIQRNKHLPNIPPAEVVKVEGLNIADIQVKQMEKIEELFLYVIELKKDNEALRNELELIKSNH